MAVFCSKKTRVLNIVAFLRRVHLDFEHNVKLTLSFLFHIVIRTIRLFRLCVL